jgi:hypothetical protein
VLRVTYRKVIFSATADMQKKPLARGIPHFDAGGGSPLVVQIPARLISAHQFDSNSRSRSNSGSDGIFSRNSSIPNLEFFSEPQSDTDPRNHLC